MSYPQCFRLARSWEQELFDEPSSPGGLPSGPGARQTSTRRARTSKESSTRPSSAVMTRISTSLVSNVQKEKLVKASRAPQLLEPTYMFCTRAPMYLARDRVASFYGDASHT